MYINGREDTIYGTLIIASADNLSSQLLRGYKGLASALRRCCFCMAVKSDMETKVHVWINNCISNAYSMVFSSLMIKSFSLVPA